MVSTHQMCQTLPPGTQGVVSTPAVRSRRMSAPCMQARPEYVRSCVQAEKVPEHQGKTTDIFIPWGMKWEIFKNWFFCHTQKVLFHTLKNNFIPSIVFHTLKCFFHTLKFPIKKWDIFTNFHRTHCFIPNRYEMHAQGMKKNHDSTEQDNFIPYLFKYTKWVWKLCTRYSNRPEGYETSSNGMKTMHKGLYLLRWQVTETFIDW